MGTVVGPKIIIPRGGGILGAAPFSPRRCEAFAADRVAWCRNVGTEDKPRQTSQRLHGSAAQRQAMQRRAEELKNLTQAMHQLADVDRDHIANIERDHHEVEKLLRMFETFAN